MADLTSQKARGAILDVSGEETCAKISDRLEAGERIPVVIYGYIEGVYSDFDDDMQSFNVEGVTFQEVAESDTQG